MSKYKRIETDIKSQDFLIKALQELGIPFEQAKNKPLVLYGYRGDRSQRAEIAIRKANIGSWSDLGFARQENGSYVAIADEHSKTKTLLDQVRQRYAYHAVCQQARVRGYNVVEQKSEDGAVRLQLVRR